MQERGFTVGESRVCETKISVGLDVIGLQFQNAIETINRFLETSVDERSECRVELTRAVTIFVPG